MKKSSKSRESKLSKLAGDYKSTTSKLEILKYSNDFKVGMTFHSSDTNRAKDGNKFVNIYKNLIRDIKRFYKNSLKDFI